jgi:alkanesulfonate monooxygenase SsuD/methylene tetrahydromethanopterin reductase-like flavin-dependent oxidoreductase (luciferase family)
VTAVAFGIQGSGQLVGGAPDPGIFREVAVRAEELGYDSIWAGDWIPVVDRYCVAGTPEQCVARVRAYVDAGAQHIVFNILELDDAQRLVEVARAAAG